MRRLLARSLFCLAAAAGSANAADGMWPLNLLPEQALRDHGLQPQIELLQRATVKLPYGTGSFVSAQGLVLTNHHVISECIDSLSSAREPLQQRGFVARRAADERRCPGMELQVLEGIDELPPLPLEAAARRERIAALEGAECPSAQRCEVVPLYGGALVQRYRSRVWRDVRLVLAPEAQAANFGGDDDNFNYPRFAFDFALLRVYEASGKPHRPRHFLRPAAQPLREGEPILVSGHPYQTQRGLTVAQLEAQRDAVLPAIVAALNAELRVLQAYAAQGGEAARQVADLRAVLENSRKARRGELEALLKPELLAQKRLQEAQVRAASGDASPWQAAAASAAAQRHLLPAHTARQLPSGSQLSLLLQALRLRTERGLPPQEGLTAYSGIAEAGLLAALGADTPFHPALERSRVAGALAHARAMLGDNDAWVQALQASSAGPSPRWARGAARLALLDASDAQLAADSDPLLQLALRLAPLQRADEQAHEREVRDPLLGASEAIARAQFQVLGRDSPPDATFTLRLSFGRAKAITSAGQRHPWQTNFGGLYARADAFDNKTPFDLAPQVAAARRKIDARAPLNFISTADIVGGNSGSPVLNARHEWVGLAFDGNLESLAGDFVYDEASNRMVALHQSAIRLALTRIYPAAHLAREMGLRP